MADYPLETEDDEEAPSTAVKVVLALLIALAVFIGGWWVFAGPSGRLTPTTIAPRSQPSGSPSSAEGASGE